MRVRSLTPRSAASPRTTDHGDERADQQRTSHVPFMSRKVMTGSTHIPTLLRASLWWFPPSPAFAWSTLGPCWRRTAASHATRDCDVGTPRSNTLLLSPACDSETSSNRRVLLLLERARSV